MTTFRSDEAFVGLVALAVTVWIAFRLRRGLREAWLPVGRGRLERAERPGPFRVLFLLYVAAALLMAFVGLDLLFGFTASR